MEEDLHDMPASTDGPPIGRRALVSGAAKLAAAVAVVPLSSSAPAMAAGVDAEFDSQGALHLGPRIVPIPKSISPEAQAALARATRRPIAGGGGYPALTDKAAWNARIEQLNAFQAAAMKPIAAKAPAHVEATKIAGVTVYVAEPNIFAKGRGDKAILHFHGGGLVMLGGENVRYATVMEAVSTGCKIYGVDYGNPPDHPYPAALDDCVAVYRELLKTHSPKNLVISGGSGGGNLAVAVPLKVRDLGMKLPAAIGLFSPEIDLTESGDTFQTIKEIDVVLRGGLPELNALYANGHDLSDPHVSPLFGDFSKGFAPTFIQTGTRDTFLSNSVRIHAVLLNAGIEAELHVGEAMPHAGFGGAPEDADMRARYHRFLDKHLA